jgi:exopolysaccharide production protein ExoY
VAFNRNRKFGDWDGEMLQYWDAAKAASLPEETRPAYSWKSYGTVKRYLDIILVLVSAPVSLILVGILALLIRLDGGEVFYRQPRVGRNGKIFRCWKLRTMVSGAERRLEEYLEHNPTARAEWDHTQKLKNDPRITRIGRFLRATSADELPQLWNVLVGDMSLVGPRPMLPEQQPLYPGTAYYDLRPGITGFWQVSDRNKSSFASRAKYDAEYARSMCFWVDMMVLFKTVETVVRGTGW